MHFGDFWCNFYYDFLCDFCNASRYGLKLLVPTSDDLSALECDLSSRYCQGFKHVRNVQQFYCDKIYIKNHLCKRAFMFPISLFKPGPHFWGLFWNKNSRNEGLQLSFGIFPELQYTEWTVSL